MAKVEKSIEVNAPVSAAYIHWTRFEEFPRFMEGIAEVRRIDDARLFWVAEIGGQRKEWYARITRQTRDEVIAWESESGAVNSGIVSFRPSEPGKTEVVLHMEYEPEDAKERAGDVLGVVSRRVEGDLLRFKEFVESQGSGGETGVAGFGESSEARPDAHTVPRPGVPDDPAAAEPRRYGAGGQGGANYGGTRSGAVSQDRPL